MNQQHRTSDEQGSVLIEFAVVLPLIFFITITGFEISRALHTLETATSLSRELVNIASRDCEHKTNFDTCLTDRRNQLEEFARQSFGLEIELIITYIENKDDVNTVLIFEPPSVVTKSRRRTGEPEPEKSRIPRTFSTRDVPGQIKITPQDIRKRRTIFIAECYVPYKPLFRFIYSGFLGMKVPFPASKSNAEDSTKKIDGFTPYYMYDVTII